MKLLTKAHLSVSSYSRHVYVNVAQGKKAFNTVVLLFIGLLDVHVHVPL